MTSVGVVVLNWNTGSLTQKCIRSLSKFVSGERLEIFLVDNGSKRKDLENLVNLGCAKTVFNEKNLGFAKANNQGIRYFTGKEKPPRYILLFNNDAYGKDDFLKPLVKFMDANPKVGLTSPLIYYDDEPGKAWFTGGRIDFAKGIVDNYKVGPKQKARPQKPFEIDWANGCAMLVRTEVFGKAGYLDEDYGSYVEDVDFSVRCVGLGWKIYLVPEAKIYHKVSASSGGRYSLKKRFMIAKNLILLCQKNFACKRLMTKVVKNQILAAANHNRFRAVGMMAATLTGLGAGLLGGIRKIAG